ncbi:hypothetical protein [Psychroserpens ponticola]|uniref:Uncharacterized protein n=1 Tax=Psychroserpens ponticola TaxID=2932268 RepID=A0ABY7RTR9_9FLAO|nr:hypothetical protein [Psychroserpens ponticola]WCO00238.1 hypothetical protein MUN68_009135 [Psychroserpens ponticola]
MNNKLYHANSDLSEITNRISNDSIFDKTNSESNSLTLTVFQDASVQLSNKSQNDKNSLSVKSVAILTNSTPYEVSLMNNDGKIIIVRQVFYNNRWRNIKSYKNTPKRFCGNSYRSKRTIKRKSSLIFAVPCLEGNIKTKFRLVLFQKNKVAIYSNEFQGFIPKRFLE